MEKIILNTLKNINLMKENKWIKNKIINIYKWNNKLFSIFLKNNIKPFISGQFTKLALNINNNYIYRFYSFVNSCNDKELEFYISKKYYGYFTNLLYKFNINDIIYISNYSYGKFTLLNIIKKKNIKYLWMISNGTGISPFLSMLQNNLNIIKKFFNKVIFLYGTDYFNNFIYLNRLLYYQNIYGYNFLYFYFFLSKEKNKIELPFFLNGRVSNLDFYNNFKINNNFLINNDSLFMLCGNSIMINNICNLLINNFNISIKNNIFFEIY